MANKKLTRSSTDVIIGGVVGGVAEYFEIDSTLLRLITLFVVIVTGIVPGALVYVVALIIIPKDTASASKNRIHDV